MYKINIIIIMTKKRWNDDCGQKCTAGPALRKVKWERQKRRYLDVVKEDMQEVVAREDEVFDRSIIMQNPLWHPCWGKTKS